MMTPDKRDLEIRKWLKENKIATIEQLKEAAGAASRMTTLRTLDRVGYFSSYSHRGSFYTLRQIPSFDTMGLWAFRGVGFSRFGNLLSTARALVEEADAGFSAAELEGVLQVEAKHALLELVRRGDIARQLVGPSFVYFSQDPGKQRQQTLMRQQRQARQDVNAGADLEAAPEELKAAIILFFSLLDEQQRRLYAGLEAARMGHGGDRTISDLLGLDPHTVAKGRREILVGSIDRQRLRKPGAGRQEMKKKRPR